MKSKLLRFSTIEETTAKRKLSLSVLQMAAFVLFAVLAFFFIVFSGLGTGQPELVSTLLDEDAVVADDAFVAEASSDNTYGSTAVNDSSVYANGSSSNYINGSWTYTFNNNPTTCHRRYYWAGNSSNNNFNSGNGWFELYGSGTVRQKEIVFTGQIRVQLQGVLANLASAGKLRCYGTATMTSTSGYDENMKWGIYNGNKTTISNSYSNPGWSSTCGPFGTSSSGKSSTQSTSTIAITGSYITIGFLARTTYSGIGGRYPCGKLSGIKLTFYSDDASAPNVSLNSVGAWAKSKDVKLTVTDGESGNSMYSYPSSATVSGTTYTFSNVTSALSGLYFRNRSYKVTDAIGYTLAQLKIDRDSPSISDVSLVTSGSTSASGVASETTYQNVWIKFTATDASSGVGTISVQNTSCNNEAVSLAASSGSTYVYGPLAKNGVYKITVNDNVSWQTTSSITCMCLDKVAPTISVSLSKTTTASSYSNGPITATFTVKDTGDATYVSGYNNTTYQNLHGITSFVVMYADSSKKPVYDKFDSITPSSSYASGMWTYTYSVVLPETGSYTFVAKDKSGRTTSATTDGTSVLNVYIDTTAPRVTGFTATDADGKNATTTWTSKNVTLTISVTDAYAAADGYDPSTSTAGGNNQNSGVSKVELRRDSTSGTVLQTYQPSGGIANGGTAQFVLSSNYNEISKYYWVVYDKAGNTSLLSTANGTYNSKTYTNYYYNKKGSETCTIRKDSNPVTIQIYDSTNTNVLSSNKDKNSTLQWTTAESTTLYLRTTFGPSGAKFNASSQAKVEVAYSTDYSKVSNPSTATWNIVSTTANSFKDAISNTSNNKASNAVNVAYNASGEGKIYYRFRLTNGADVVADTGIVTVQRDRNGPSVKLLGFGSYAYSSAHSTDAQVISACSNFVSESVMYNMNSWFGGSTPAAIIAVKDTYSGADKASQTYNVSENTTASQVSKAKAKVTFSFKGYSYEKSTDYYLTGSGMWILVVPLWNLTEINANCPAVVSADGKLLKGNGEGEAFSYKIQVADFCGNVAEVLNSGNNSNLQYKVDPFELDFRVTAINQIDDSGNVTTYQAIPTGKWTRNKVRIEIDKTQIGLSATNVWYYLKDVNDAGNTVTGTTSNVPLNSSDVGTIGWSQSMVKGDTGTGSTAYIEFSNTSRLVQVVIMTKNGTADGNGSEAQYGGPGYYGVDNSFIVIKQDTDAPNLNGSQMGFFFSTNGNITNPFVGGSLHSDILLYYATTETNNNTYIAKRITQNTNQINVWVNKKVYLYIVATDKKGVGMGSGINTVKYSVGSLGETLDSANLVYTDSEKRCIYRSSEATLGYTTATMADELKLTLTDNQSNTTGVMTIAKDTDGHKLCPVVDTVKPTLAITSATYASGSGTASYLNNATGKFIGNEDNVLRNDLQVMFSVSYGMSDVQIYIRKRTFLQDISSYVDGAQITGNNQGFLTAGGIDLSQWTAISGKNFTAPTSGFNTAVTSGWAYTVNSKEAIKNRYDILAVTGTGLYYYFDAGDVFIDTVPPKIEEVWFATVTNPTTAIPLSTYTNDDMYAYYKITDINGSGVLDSTVYTVSPTSGTVLEKVTVNGNEYYRLLLTASNNYKITAADKAGNVVTNASTYKPNIDKTIPVINITMKKKDGTSYEYHKLDSAYTNSEYITVTISVSYGLSGLGKVMYCSSDDAVNWTNYSDLSTLLSAINSNAQWTQNANMTQSTITFNISNEQYKYYKFYATNGVTVFKTNDATSTQSAIKGAGTNNEDYVKIAIDKTAPVVNVGTSVVLHNGNIDATAKYITLSSNFYGTNNWYYDGISLGLDAVDPNSYGSGINRIKVDHVLNGISQNTYWFSEVDGYYYAMNNTQKFVYDHYADYVITLVDNAGNQSQITVRPQIDTVQPKFSTDIALKTVEGNTVVDTYVPSSADYVNWTAYDVQAIMQMAIGISGAKLQYAVMGSNGRYGNWNDVVSYSYGSYTVNNDGVSKGMNDSYLFTPSVNKVSFDYTYKFRLVSIAGYVGDEVVVGRIKIDQETPEITVNTLIQQHPLKDHLLEDLTNTDPYKTVMSGWTKENVSVQVTSTSAFASGYKVGYNLNLENPDWKYIELEYDNGTFRLSKAGKEFVHKIATSLNNKTYQYKFVNGAGTESAVYTVSGIKIDMENIDFTVGAEVSDLVGAVDASDPEKFGTTSADNYLHNKLLDTYQGSVSAEEIAYINNVLGYTYGTYTSRNSVILKVSISKVSYSGISVYINGKLYESFSYDEYGTISSNNTLDRYYVINNDLRNSSVGYYSTADKMYKLDIKVMTGSGNYVPQDVKRIAIDNDIPMIYVAGVTGKKSTNWDITDPDSCWYISADTAINLRVGTLVKEGGSYQYSNLINTSGYKIYYSLNGGEWIDNDTASQIKIIGKPAIENAVYRFKIVSKAGLEYILGSVAVDNMGNNVYSVEQVESMISDNGGLVDHLGNEKFSYRMNVDSNTYGVYSQQLLPFVVSGKEIVEESLDYSFANYEIYRICNILDANGNVTGTREELMLNNYYNHGDRIVFKYTANTDDKYYHRYSEYGIYTDGEFVESDMFGYGVDTDEVSGEFNYQFVENNLNVKSYFIKELEVQYDGTVIYRQSQSNAEVSATSSYSYKGKDTSNNLVTLTVSIPLSVGYMTMAGKDVSGEKLPVGGYLVNTTLQIADGNEINALSFRLINPQTVLLVKYFDNQADGKYVIYEEEDLNYVSETIYNGFSGTTGNFELTDAQNYYDCDFVLNNNITLSNNFVGINVFNGTFDGQENTISAVGKTVNGEYGMFRLLKGTVENLVIDVAGEIVVANASNVGVLASVVDGGTINNVRVNADILLAETTANTNVGGLVGQMTQYSLVENVFVDVNINNNGKVLTNGNVGGLVGYMAGGTLQNTYTYSHIVVYNTTGINVGAVVGDGATTSFTSGNVSETYVSNQYLSNNVFVNDNYKNGFIGTASNAEAYAEAMQAVDYAAFVSTTSDVPGSKTVAGELIKYLVLEELYNTFGESYDAEKHVYNNGLGTVASPFNIQTAAQMRVIDQYVNLHFELNENVDMTAFGSSIGLHQVFGGSFDGNGHKLFNYDGISIGDGNTVGLFAAVSGNVKSLIITDVDMDIETNDGTIYVGVISGKLIGGTVNDIILIGNLDVVSDGTVYAGAIAGIAEGGNVYDIFSIVNVKVNARMSAVVGGIVGQVDNTAMGGETADKITKSVYALGRVEAHAISLTVGAVTNGTQNASSASVYAIANNVYGNGQIQTSTVAGYVNMVSFGDGAMRASTFSDGTNVFNKVFVTDKLYYFEGLGTEENKFKVTTAEEFLKIEHMLYANYNIKNDITFDEKDESKAFKTIGYKLKFTGSIDGKNENSWSAEEGTMSSLMNVTDSLVYENSGSITDLSVNVYYEKTVASGEELVFGAIAVINRSGTLRNVIVGGEINIVGQDKYNTTVVVSGFVGIGYSGTIRDSKMQNSISGLAITVQNVGTVYAGGYVGIVDGIMTLSYGIGNGTLAITNCGNSTTSKSIYAGTIVGAAYRENEWTSLDETQEYRYIVTVDGELVTNIYGYSIASED